MSGIPASFTLSKGRNWMKWLTGTVSNKNWVESAIDRARCLCKSRFDNIGGLRSCMPSSLLVFLSLITPSRKGRELASVELLLYLRILMAMGAQIPPAGAMVTAGQDIQMDLEGIMRSMCSTCIPWLPPHSSHIIYCTAAKGRSLI
jgi:hypothetical protein